MQSTTRQEPAHAVDQGVCKKRFRTLQRSCSSLPPAKSKMRAWSLAPSTADTAGPVSIIWLPVPQRLWQNWNKEQSTFHPRACCGSQGCKTQLKLTFCLLQKGSGPWKTVLCSSPRSVLGRVNRSVGSTRQAAQACKLYSLQQSLLTDLSHCRHEGGGVHVILQKEKSP